MTKEQILDYFADINFYYNNSFMYLTLQYMLNDLQRTPIEAKWENKYTNGLLHIICSNCKKETMIKTKYCPECGAKMDHAER